MFRQNTILILGFIFIFYGCKKEPSNESPNVQANWTFINDQNSLLGNNVVGLEISPTGQTWVATTNPFDIPDTNIFWNQSLWQWDTTYISTDYYSELTCFSGLNQEGTIDSNVLYELNGRLTSFTFDDLGNIYYGVAVRDSVTTYWTSYIVKTDIFTNTRFLSPSSPGYDFEDLLYNNNGLWFGSGNSGLMNLNGGVFTEYNSWNSILPYPNYVLDLVAINHDEFYLNTNNAILKMSTGGLEMIYPNYIWGDQMVADNIGNLWIGYMNTLYPLPDKLNLLMYDGIDTTLYTQLLDQGLNPEVTDMVCDHLGNIWIATNYSGLVMFDGVQWRTFTPSNSQLHSLNITHMAVDVHGNLWIGSSDEGVAVLNINIL